METNNKQKKGINIIDLLTVVILVGAIIFGAMYLFGGNETKQAKDTVRFSLESLGVEEEVISDIKEGQIVTDGKTKSVLGKVVSIHKVPARVMVEDHDNETIELKEYPNKIDLTLEIEANAEIGHPDIMLDTFALKVGKHTDCIVGDTKVSAYVIDIDDKDIFTKKDVVEEGENK